MKGKEKVEDEVNLGGFSTKYGASKRDFSL